MIYSLSVEIEADSLGEAFERIKELPTKFSDPLPAWLRAYNLYGGVSAISYVNRLDVSIPDEEPEGGDDPSA